MKSNSSDESTASVASKKGVVRKMVPKVGNLLMWILFCVMTATGLMLAYRLPPGSRGGHGLHVLGWHRHEWGDLHLWVSYGFLALIVIHLALHWRWFWQVVGKRRMWPILVGVLAGLSLVVMSFCLPVERDKSCPANGESGHGGEGGGRQYRGGRDR